MIGNVYAAICPPGNCQAAVSSNVPSSDGTIWVEVDNNTSNRVPLPQTFNFPYNTAHTIKVLNSTFTGTSTSGHYVWKDWANYYGTQQRQDRLQAPTSILSRRETPGIFG